MTQTNRGATGASTTRGTTSGSSSVVSTAKRQITQQMDKKSTEIGQQIASAADAVRGVGRQLGDDKPAVAKLTEGVALRVDGVAGYLAERSPEQIVGDIKDLAAREPVVFAGACFALGLLAARVVKAAIHGSGDTAGGSASTSSTERARPTGPRSGGGTGSTTSAGAAGRSRSRTTRS